MSGNHGTSCWGPEQWEAAAAAPLGYTLLAGEMERLWQLKSILIFILALVSTMLVKSTVCINPIIYFGLNPQFRGEILKKLKMFDEPMRAV